MSESDLQFYIANKELLESKNGFATKRTGEFAGLRNHGATCYLNSLIQCLFHDSEFVKLIMESSDNPDSAIITEMKKLFARLIMSTNQAIDTESLLTAFGWSKSQLFEQHDIHELFSVLLDALGKDSASLNAGITKLFQGHMTDVLKCSSCAHESKNATTFLNFSLDMPDHTDTTAGAAAAGTAPATHCQLRDLLHKHLQPETLDADNMWLCSGCQNKVCATKAQAYSQLPRAMMVHLKRFRYDPLTKRRRKLTTPVHFPLTLSADEFFGTAGNFGTYRLSGVVLHSGTAMGGHYRCYVSTGSDGASWVDCNDASVSALTSEDVRQMFAEPTASAFTAGGKGSFVHDNVYMLLYKAVDGSNATASLSELKQLIPAPIQAEIDAENESFLVRFRVQDIRSHVVSLTVRVHDNAAQAAVQLDLLKTTTLGAALVQAHHQLVSQNKLDAATYPITNCRLRKYGKRNLSSLGETFGGRDNATLEDIGLTSTATLALEVRTANDAEFTEFNPSDMNLQFTVWSADTSAPRVEHSVLVPNREQATVADLRAAVAHKLGVDGSRLVLIKDDATVALELLSADTNVLTTQHRVFPGDNTIVVEIAPEGADAAYKSAAFSALEESRNKAVIYYNKPTSSDAGASSAETAETDNAADSAAKRDANYPFSVEVSVDMTLAAFKAQVATALGISDPNSFYCKRNGAASAPQLKDEGKTLRELAFVNHSVIHLQLGQGCKSGEHMLKIEIDTASPTAALQSLTDTAAESGIGGIAGAAAQVFVALGDLAVSEKSTVLQLKQQLFAQWSDLASRSGPEAAALAAPQSAAHIRLRDGKSGKVSGPLRDDRIVGRCLLGLADGRRLVAQVLDAPECISADDLVISLRVASFDRRVLYPSIDLPITRSSTMKALYDKIASLVPQLNEPLPAEYLQENPAEVGSETLSLAKGFTSGPALTLKSAFKLKWDEPAVLHALANPTPAGEAAAAEAPVEVISAEEAANGEIDEAILERSKNLGSVGGLDRPPLNLRDGSIVVVRSKADFWRATLTMRARKAQEDALEEAGVPRRPTTAGTGAAVARNRKSVKARIAAANGTASGSASADVSEDEVLVKGAPPSQSQAAAGASAKRGGERGLKINASNKDRPPVPADGVAGEAKLSPNARKGTVEDELEHSMEDLPPPVAE